MRDYAEIAHNLRCCGVGVPCDDCTYQNDITKCASLEGQAADAIKELQAAVPHWISVEERLPEIDTSVLMCAFGKSVGEGTYRGYDGVHHVWKMYAVSGTYWDDEVTHWMPLPAPPKEVE